MKATVLDTKTGLMHVIKDVPAISFVGGNYGCDCNRSPEDGSVDDGAHCGSDRFLVVAVEYEEIDGEYRGYTLAELNEGYPPALLETWAKGALGCKHHFD